MSEIDSLFGSENGTMVMDHGRMWVQFDVSFDDSTMQSLSDRLFSTNGIAQSAGKVCDSAEAILSDKWRKVLTDFATEQKTSAYLTLIYYGDLQVHWYNVLVHQQGNIIVHNMHQYAYQAAASK